MMPTAELLVMETTRSAACPKQLSTKRNRRKGITVSFIEACFLCQEYSMGLKLTTCDPENFGFADSRCGRWHGRLARLSCRRSTPWLGGVTFVDRRRSIRQQPRRVAWRATSESVSDPGLVRAAASHRGTAAAAPVNGSVEKGRLRSLPSLLALWVRRNVGDLLCLSRQRFSWRGTRQPSRLHEGTERESLI